MTMTDNETLLLKYLCHHLAVKNPITKARYLAHARRHYYKNHERKKAANRLREERRRRAAGIKAQVKTSPEERYIQQVLWKILRKRCPVYAAAAAKKQAAHGLRWYRKNKEYALWLCRKNRRLRMLKNPELRRRATFFSSRNYWQNPERARKRVREGKAKKNYGVFWEAKLLSLDTLKRAREKFPEEHARELQRIGNERARSYKLEWQRNKRLSHQLKPSEQ